MHFNSYSASFTKGLESLIFTPARFADGAGDI